MIVTSNPGKLKEYQQKLTDVTLIPYRELYPDLEIEEVGSSFRENAYLKAIAVYRLSHKPCIADDSGLIVEALPHQLGVHSKRFSKEMTDEANMALLLEQLQNVKNRHAYFHTTICYIEDEKHIQFYQGEVHGHILNEKRGNNGFGYDPIFEINGLNKTMAECTLEEKNLLSHRSKAIEALAKDLIK